MFSLSYTSAYDPYHTVFRYLVLLSSAENNALPYRTARAADFFLCFPWFLKDVKAPRSVTGFAKDRNALVRSYTPNSYERVPNERLVFERMEVIQAAAVSALAGANMIDADILKSHEVRLLPSFFESPLLEPISVFKERNANLVDFLAKKLPQMDVHGPDGIFARTRLGEFSYDNV